jgi:uncharacterized protein involved in exopolysaccharide biosynthesis
MSAEDPWMEEPQGSDIFVRQLISIGMNPLGLIRRRWFWMLPALLLGLLVTASIPYVVTPEYTARATVLISSQQIPEDFVRSTVSGLDSLANVNSLMGEVLSQKKLSGLIDRYDLYPSPNANRSVAASVVKMRGSIDIQKQRTVKDRSSPRKETSSIFVISFTYPEPVAAADVANALAGIFVDENIEKRSEQAHLTTEFLSRQLRRAEADMQVINRQIADFRQEHRGEMPGDMQGLIGRLERLETQRQTITMQIKDSEILLSQLQSAASPHSESQIRLEQLRMQLDSDLAAHTDEHPNVIALKRRIERLEREVESGGREVPVSAPTSERIAQTQRDLRNLRARLADADRLVVDLDSRVSRIPAAEEKLAALEERAQVLRDTYVEFLRKVQEAQLSETLERTQQGPRVSILDPASVPTTPAQPIAVLLAMGVVASLMLALVAGLGLELIDPVVLSEEHLEAAGSAPLLGAVRQIS